jgi:hypothetical protein
MPVVETHLRLKHKQMRKSLFLFFRGTFYRWAQLWPEVCANLRDAPKVLAVGDLHVGSFGTWRDTEGRLSWGIDDFDESYPLPYTNDLVRLAASVKIVIDSEHLTIRFKEGCSAILEGYQKALKAGGCPFVLAELAKNLERQGVEAFEPPDGFWEKLDHLPVVNHGLPRDAKKVLQMRSWITKWCAAKPAWGASGNNDSSPLAVGKDAKSRERRKPSYPRHAFGWMVTSEVASPAMRMPSSPLCDRTIHFRRSWGHG